MASGSGSSISGLGSFMTKSLGLTTPAHGPSALSRGSGPVSSPFSPVPAIPITVAEPSYSPDNRVFKNYGIRSLVPTAERNRRKALHSKVKKPIGGVGRLSFLADEKKEEEEEELRPRKPLMLPSFHRMRRQNYSEEFKDDMLQGLNIQGDLVTNADLLNFQKGVKAITVTEAQWYHSLQKNLQVGKDDLEATVKMDQLMNWVNNPKYYNEVRNLITQEVMENPDLRDRYNWWVQHEEDPFLEPKAEYEDWRLNAKKLKDMPEEKGRDNIDMGMYSTGDKDMEHFKELQFEKIVKLFFISKQELMLKSLLERPEFNAFFGNKAAVQGPALSKIVAKEQIRALDPSAILRALGRGLYDGEDIRNRTDLKILKDFANEWSERLKYDRIATENGMMSLSDYIKSVQEFWDAIPLYIKPTKNDILGKSADLDDVNPNELKDLVRKNRGMYVQGFLEQQRSQNRKKILTSLNMFNDQLRRVQMFINARPDLNAAKILKANVNTVINELNAGQIDVDEAYKKMNAITHRKRAMLTNYDEAYINLPYVEEKKLQEQDERIPLSHRVSMSGVQQRIEPKISYTDYMHELRENNSLFAFPQVELKKGADEKKVQKYVYDLKKGTKKDMYSSLKKLEKELKDTVYDFIIKPVNQTPENYAKILTGISDHFAKSSGLRDLEFDVQTYPMLSQYVADPSKKDPRDRYALYGKNPSTMTDQEKQMLKDEYLRVETLIGDMHMWLKNHGRVNRRTVKELRDIRDMVKPKVTKPFITVAKPAPMLFDLPRQPKQLHIRENPPLHETETPAQKAEREKNYTFEHLKYSTRATKEYPETLKTEIGDNIIEYNVKTTDDLERMRSEVGRLLATGGSFFIVDLKTGRLFPIELQNTFIKQTYIYMKNAQKEGAGFALNPALDDIYRNTEELLPYPFMRHDKMMAHIARMPGRKFSHDYRDQIRAAKGAGLWGHIRKGIMAAGQGIQNYALNQTSKAVSKFQKDTFAEGRNFVKQEKRNLNGIYNAGATFVKNPSVKNFSSGYWTASNNLGKLVLQPVLTGAREFANVSDLASNIPGVNVAKFGIEYAIPPLAVADALSHGVKSAGLGSDDKMKYFDTALNMGDALLGSQSLKGVFDTSARLLQTGAKVADVFLDKENHNN